MIHRNFLKVLLCLTLTVFGTTSCTLCKNVCEPPATSPPPVIQSLPIKPEPVPEPATATPVPAGETPQLPETAASELPAKDASKPAPDQDRAFERLGGEVKRIAAWAGGTVGVSALHIESGQSFSYNGGIRFPMASAYKIPIAVQLLRRVDREEIHLNSTVTLHSSDIHPGSGKLVKTFKKKEASYTVRELLELMLLVSDNSASDALLKLAGGPAAVTSAMKDLGIQDIDVSRSTLNMLADWRGISELPSPAAFHLDKYNRLRDSVPAEALEKAQNRFYSDLRDTATPDAMTNLMAMICKGTVLKAESASVLLKIMERCQTGKSRVKGLIPPGMAVANKTGTIGQGIVNDTAVLTLPADAGHVALTIFIRNSTCSVSRQEQAMAQMARYLYDYFFFQSTDLFGTEAGESCSVEDPACSR